MIFFAIKKAEMLATLSNVFVRNPTNQSSFTQSCVSKFKRFKSSLLVIFFRFLSVIAGLAYIKTYTSALSLDEVGVFFYLGTLSYALSALIFVPVDFYMQARLSKLDILPKLALRRLIGWTLALGLLACIVLGSPLIWLGKLNASDLPSLYAVAALLYLCSTLRNLLNNRGSIVFVGAMLLLESLARLCAFVAVASVFGASASTLMASAALALGVEMLFILWHIQRKLLFGCDQTRLDDTATILRVAAPISGSALCNAVQLQTFRVAYPLAGLSATSGVYGVVANIGGQAMAVCNTIYAQIETPRLYKTQGTSIKRYVAFAAALALAIFAFTMMLAPFLVSLLTKAQYLPYAYAIGFGVVTEACNLIIGAYTIVLSIERRTHLLLKLNLVAAALSVAGCLAAINFRPQDPFVIGWTLAGSQLFMTLTLIALASRKAILNTES